MSSISQIKNQVIQIGGQASSTAGQLSQLAKNLEKNIAAVNNAIKGTASGEDKEMVAAFQQAIESVKSASAALQKASNSAKSWAQKA